MGTIEEAIKMINVEIQKRPADRYLALVGEHIIDCITTETAAKIILDEKKTLSGAIQKIRSEAERQKQGSVAVIEDSVVYGWAREYFGLTDTPQGKWPEATKPQMAAEAPAESKKEKEINLDFDSFFA